MTGPPPIATNGVKRTSNSGAGTAYLARAVPFVKGALAP